MRARVAHDVGQHEGHAGELNAEQLEPLPLSPTLARDARHAVRSASMLVPITTSTSSPARLKTRVGGSTSPRALRVGKFPRQPRGPHRETTTRARRFTVGSRKYLSPEPLLQSPDWVMSELQSGYQVPAYSYARNNPVMVVDPNGKNPGAAVVVGGAAVGVGAAVGAAASFWCLAHPADCREAVRRISEGIGDVCRPVSQPLKEYTCKLQGDPNQLPLPGFPCVYKCTNGETVEVDSGGILCDPGWTIRR